jgi:hypothetical protein
MAACLTLACGCDGLTSAGGVIVDEAGNPIADADVEMSANEGRDISKKKSSKKGVFDLMVTHAPYPIQFTLKVEKDGYDSVELPLNLDENDRKNTDRIVLKKKAAPE